MMLIGLNIDFGVHVTIMTTYNVVTMVTLEKIMETKIVGIRDAKIHLSRLVKLVRNGNEVTLTDRGKPVCKIVPITPQSLSFDEQIRRLEEQGVIEPISGAPMEKLPPPLPVEKGLAQKYLQEDRNHGV